MRILKIILFILMLIIPFAAYAADKAPESYPDAVRLYEAGRYGEAEGVLARLLASAPASAKYHHLLGKVYKKEGRLKEAQAEFGKAMESGGENAELLKDMAETHKWTRDYAKAESEYEKALKLDPNDREAAEDLKALKARAGLRFRATTGSMEADYTTKSYEASIAYGGFDRLELNGGYSYSDNVYYTRSKVYGSAYYFYSPGSYVKLALSHKDYNYPVDPAVQKPNPDSNSYDKLPTVEVEVSHWFNRVFRGSLAYEYFRPSFFYDTSSHANNSKVSTELYYITPLDYLRLKLMYAILRDPDSNSTEIKGRDNLNTPLGVAQSTEVRYKTSSLLGAGAEVVKDRWNAELKYLPNRDLDSSYKYSILAGAGYDFTDRVTGRLDYVHDKYSSKSSYSGKTANVYLASAFYKLTGNLDVGAGYKYIDLPTKNDNAVFLTLAFRSGLGF